MPELPEVEVTRRQIAPFLIDRTVAKVITTQPSYVFLTPPGELKKQLQGGTFLALVRQGKYLLAELDNGGRLLIHLGMTGQLFTESARNPRLVNKKQTLTSEPAANGFQPDVHTHLQLAFDDSGPRVYFRDVRKFGKLRWLLPQENDPRLTRLGVDALLATGSDFLAAAKRRSSAVKSLLLDQSVIAGCGNIYADEALFAAGISPKRPANRLSARECNTLIDALRAILERSIESGGSSMSDYVTPSGADGAYQNERLVYAREGEPCRNCKAPIRREVLGQRSSHYCPKCQRE
jgi:formamidopyrimidine-DNA glycosylase